MSVHALRPSPRHFLIHLLVLFVLIAGLLSSAASTLAAQTASRDDDVASVTAALTELSRLEAAGNFQHVYDLMAPDARLLLPRTALVDWLNSGETPVAADDPENVEIDFDDWTWETSGEDYTDVATVTYAQDVALDGDEVTRELERRFVFDGQRWRWFPEITEDRIAALIDDLEASLDYRSPFERVAVLRIDTFWAETFEAVGLDYDPPGDIVAIDAEPFETGCGVERNIDEAAIYYCTVDDTIYYSPEFRSLVIDLTGPFGWYNIVAHEWGHHIQDLLGIDASRNPELDDGYYVIELELMADCLAGVYAQDATARGTIEEEEVDDAESITEASGDLPETAFDDERAHGTGEQRVGAFFTGYEDGLIGCNLNLASFADAG
ncbi:MAG: neutral zinc metallopeptidase [Chloroflexia bacterium]|nr:neutral zinc metallopeptidase [Chloroflexia bacterium]